ncbi:DNA topoisomerase type I [Western grey kangaroopox virus]|uniref:DNA topoisomerase n=1 Tax=Western grey kangaroopox virus TaxID=1566307 RepID=A0A2C9DSN8_9POXV|nr:DNA topoisomerase type I [Western grey kangaroopox virus]ATI21021.1 DNA topoisomerase type I [Western grey kangaroopox virus]
MRKFFYYSDGVLYYDRARTRQVPEDNATYEVLRRVRVPAHLSDVIVYEQTYEEALEGLVFVGVDSRGRKQYFYGQKHVQRRNARRDRIFVRVHRIIRCIHRFIEEHVDRPERDARTQLAIFLLMETSFYIRTGKVRYHRDNDTVGLLTLQNKHLSVEGDCVTIRFRGKDRVEHEFMVRNGERLYSPLRNLHMPEYPDRFLFSKLSERKIYRFMRQFSVTVKDLRTYGVNVTLLFRIWSNVTSMVTMPPLRKLIAASVRQTADAIGHSPGISRGAYMALTVLDMVREGSIVDIIRERSFEEFLEFVVEHVHKKSSG